MSEFLTLLSPYWPLIQTVAFLVSAAAAVALILHNARVARKQALIQLIIQQRSDERFKESLRTFFRLANSPENLLSRYAATQIPDGENAEEFRRIRTEILNVLNTQEFVAVGIRLKAFDEDVYKQLQCSNVRKIWSAASGLIYELRKQNHDTVFQDLERLAKRWEDDPLKRIH